MGLLRRVVVAPQLGAGPEADAYQAAFQLPDMVSWFLGTGGALSIAFIPFYTRARATSGAAAAERLVAVLLGTMTAVATLVTVVLWWQADHLVGALFDGF